MIAKRLELALDLLKREDWGQFERLASSFLAAEFHDLRTTASPSGDEGRDSELFSPVAEPTVVFQYSVSENWKAKISSTVKRLNKTHPAVVHLIYMSNQVIGSKADHLRRTLRTEEGISLDVRNRSWFVERVLQSAPREQAAEELARRIVDPYLASRGVSKRTPTDLSTPESIAAATFLGLQWQDDIREKGLTKIAFEALVRASLENTDSVHRMTRQAILSSIQKIFPDHPASKMEQLVNTALNQLTRRAIRHWQKEDEFCLMHEEKQRAIAFETSSALSDSALIEAINTIALEHLPSRTVGESIRLQFANCLRSATDAVLF